MAVSGTVPSRQPPAWWEPTRAASAARRTTWVIGAVAIGYFFARYGSERVPLAMDTVPAIPPGSWCIVDRLARAARVGSHVFVDVPAGGTVLSRVVRIDEREVVVEHPNARSVLPDSRMFGPLPIAALRSTVLVVFTPEGARRGR